MTVSVNVVVLAGTIAADPVERRMPSGEECTEIRLSVPESGRRLLPLPVVAWHTEVGKKRLRDLHQGDEVLVYGRLDPPLLPERGRRPQPHGGRGERPQAPGVERASRPRRASRHRRLTTPGCSNAVTARAARSPLPHQSRPPSDPARGHLPRATPELWCAR